jgi:phosphatidylglycerophosphatase A
VTPEGEQRAVAPLRVALLSAFGLGVSPIMPGTVASLAVALLLWAVGPAPLRLAAAAVALLVLGCVVTLRFARDLPHAGDHGDPGWVVSDEVAGQALACLAAVPFGGGWLPMAAAFVLFRVFDITKWGPVGALERRPGAAGILLDDIAAGAIAGVLVLAAGALGAFALP